MTPNSSSTTVAANESTLVKSSETTQVPAPFDDSDLDDVVLGERQADACSMEEGCTSCQ
jgi:hypothetical protein